MMDDIISVVTYVFINVNILTLSTYDNPDLVTLCPSPRQKNQLCKKYWLGLTYFYSTLCTVEESNQPCVENLEINSESYIKKSDNF